MRSGDGDLLRSATLYDLSRYLEDLLEAPADTGQVIPDDLLPSATEEAAHRLLHPLEQRFLFQAHILQEGGGPQEDAQEDDRQTESLEAQIDEGADYYNEG